MHCIAVARNSLTLKLGCLVCVGCLVVHGGRAGVDRARRCYPDRLASPYLTRCPLPLPPSSGPQEQFESSNTLQAYLCPGPGCGKTYTSLDAATLVDPMDLTFK